MPTIAKCSNCGAALSAGAQFCHACGTRQSSPASSPIPLPWMLGGFAVVLVAVAAIAYNLGRSSSPDGGPPAGGAPFAAAGTGVAPDISSLSPREQADRLFNLVMTAHEQGDQARMAQFTPMALQAYGLLGTLDPDAHYHVGLMSAVRGNLAEAKARVDSIEQAEPGHLLGLMLQHSVAQLEGDQAAVPTIYRRFLDNYDRQIASGRMEYADHQRAIESFRAQAQGAVGGG